MRGCSHFSARVARLLIVAIGVIQLALFAADPRTGVRLADFAGGLTPVSVLRMENPVPVAIVRAVPTAPVYASITMDPIATDPGCVLVSAPTPRHATPLRWRDADICTTPQTTDRPRSRGPPTA